MKYKYKFQNLLNYKDTVETLKKSEYGKAINILREEENILEAYSLEKEKVLEQIEDKNRMSIRDLRMYNNYLYKVNNDIENQNVIVLNSRRDVEKAQENLILATQEKKTFEKLKEKHFEEFLIEEKKKEDKLIDEIVTFKMRTQ